MRCHHDYWQAHEVMVFADELDMHLLPQVGAAWMRQGTPAAIMTPGKNAKHYLAGALHLATGKVLYCPDPRKNNGLFRELLTLLDTTYPASRVTRIYVVVDIYCIHKAQAVARWIASHPRFALLWLPTYFHVPTPLRGCSAMGTTSAHGIINGNASAIWRRMSSGIWKRTDPGSTGSSNSMMHRRPGR